MKHGAEVLADEHDVHVMRWSDDAGAPEFRLSLAGRSSVRQRFEAWGIQSMDVLGIPPLTFVRHDLVLAPMPSSADWMACGIPTDETVFARDAQEHLLRIIKLQRRIPHTVAIPGGEVQRYGIGGEVIATELTPAGISKRINHLWPDKPDEPIQFEAMLLELFTPSSAPTRQLPRQQRRALEGAR